MKQHSNKFLITGVFFALLLGATFIMQPAWAVNIFNKKGAQQSAVPQKKSTQEYYINNEETFLANAKSFHRIPFNDPQLEFDILLPKDWTAAETNTLSDGTADLSRKILGQVARFKSPYIGTMQATVTLQTMKLDREMTAADWLKNHVLLNGYEMDGAMEIASDKKASVNCVSSSMGKSDYAYMTAQFNGSNVLLVRFETPIYLKDHLAFLRKRAIDSFRFVLGTEQSIEPQKTFEFSDALKVNYPQSWEVNNADTRDITNMSMQMFNKDQNGQIVGLIRFVVIRRHAETTLQKEAGEIRKYFTDLLNLEFKTLSHSETPTPPARFPFTRLEVYQVVPKKDTSVVGQEVRFAVFGNDEWYVFVSLLSPLETTNFYTWATNKRAFDLVLRSVK